MTPPIRISINPLKGLAGFFALSLLGIFLMAPVALAKKADTVARLDKVRGGVEVIKAKTKQTIKGRNGLLLYGGDVVLTEDKGRVTILFRDGSEIRLFSKTRFLVEAAKESKTKARSFRYNLSVRFGGIWANFVRQRQAGTIRTPTATIGIKGTTLRLSERPDGTRIALTEGLIEVKNDRASIDLTPGKQLTRFKSTDTLADKITEIPLKLDIKSETRELEFNQNEPTEAFVTVQLINVKSGAHINRAGPVYFRSNYDQVSYPVQADLDQRGFLRVPLSFQSPDSSHSPLQGNIYIWAVLDEEDALDVGEGRVLFKFKIPAGTDKIRIESDSGKSSQM